MEAVVVGIAGEREAAGNSGDFGDPLARLPGETRTAWKKRRKSMRHTSRLLNDPDHREKLLERQKDQREKLTRDWGNVVCSWTWLRDLLPPHNEKYYPNKRCLCDVCRARFPKRLYPSEARESEISGDCQIETAFDPELAEDLEKLRNDRERVGSTFVRSRRRRESSFSGVVIRRALYVGEGEEGPLVRHDAIVANADETTQSD